MTSQKKQTKDHGRTSLTKTNTPVIQICDTRRFKKEHPFLSELLRDDGVLFECDGQAPSPSKDYGQLQVTTDKVILRWWKISLRNIEDARYPGEIKDSYEDFYHDEVCQREIWRIFGQATLDYCLNLVQGKFDWLLRIPQNIQTHILSFVNLDDIPQLSLASKSLRTLCRDNDLWKIYYGRHYGRQTLQNRDLIHLAERRGWRHVFFTSRLRLQMELRREAQLERHHPEDPTDFLKSRERRSKIQPSPPSTPREKSRHVQPSIRRHSFATRQEPPTISPRLAALQDQEESPRTARSYIEERVASPRIPRPESPSTSVRSLAGSSASSSSAQPPHRITNRH